MVRGLVGLARWFVFEVHWSCSTVFGVVGSWPVVSWFSVVSLGSSCSVFRCFAVCGFAGGGSGARWSRWYRIVVRVRGSVVTVALPGGVRRWRFVAGGFVVSCFSLVSLDGLCSVFRWPVAGGSWARWSRTVVRVRWSCWP